METSIPCRAPIAAFFGNGWDEKYEFISLPLAVGPRDGTGLACYFQMPSRRAHVWRLRTRVMSPLTHLYYYVDYTEMDKLPANSGRFHAWFNHETTDALPEGETEWGLVGTRVAM